MTARGIASIALIILGVMFLFGVVVVVIAIVAAAKRSSSQSSQAFQMMNHPNMRPIREIAFANGQRPEKLILTTYGSVWYGPVNGMFVQVPQQYLIPMDKETRRGIASVLAQTMGYTWYQGPAQTGNPEVDSTAEMILVSNFSGRNIRY